MDEREIEQSVLAKQAKHQFHLDQYADEELLKINSMLHQVEREILHDWDKMTDFSQARAITLLENTRSLTGGVKATISTSLAELSGRVSAQSAEAHGKILSFGGRAANVTEVILQEPVMTSFWKTTPVGGHLLKDWVDKTFDGPTIDKIQKEIATGMFKGESYRELGKRLSTGFGMTKNEIDTLTRTYVQTANVDAMMRTYKENSDIVKKLGWSCAHLKSTCLICLSLDGHTFLVEDFPPCPAHPRCRCTPVPDMSWALLGLKGEDGGKLTDFLEKPKELQTTGKQWFNGLKPKDQKRVLGPGRFSLIQQGLISFDDLVDLATFRIKTIKELVGDTGLVLSVKSGSAEAAAIAKGKTEAKNFQSMLAQQEEVAAKASIVAKAKADHLAEQLAASKDKAAIQAAVKAEEDAFKKAEVVAKVNAQKEAYYKASAEGKMDTVAKLQQANLIADMESAAGMPISDINLLEKAVAEREYYKNLVEGLKVKYAKLDDMELDQKGLFLEKIQKYEAKLGPDHIKTTYSSIEAFTAELLAKEALAAALEAEAEAALVAAAKAKKKSDNIKIGMAKANAAKIAAKEAAKAAEQAAEVAAKEARSIEKKYDLILAAKAAEKELIYASKLLKDEERVLALAAAEKAEAEALAAKKAATAAKTKATKAANKAKLEAEALALAAKEAEEAAAALVKEAEALALEAKLEAEFLALAVKQGAEAEAKAVADALALKETSKAQLLADFKNPYATAVFKADTELPDGMFTSTSGPNMTHKEIWEPEMVATAGKGKSTGAIVFDKESGKVYIYEPSGHFGGYEHTFPKGQLEPDLTMQQNAIKEIWEEIGMDVELVDFLGDYEKSTSMSRYYVGVVKGGNPTAFGWETQAVKVIPKNELANYLNKPIDKKIAADFNQMFKEAETVGKGDAVAGFKKMNAEMKAISETPAATPLFGISDALKKEFADIKEAYDNGLINKIKVDAYKDNVAINLKDQYASKGLTLELSDAVNMVEDAFSSGGIVAGDAAVDVMNALKTPAELAAEAKKKAKEAMKEVAKANKAKAALAEATKSAVLTKEQQVMAQLDYDFVAFTKVVNDFDMGVATYDDLVQAENKLYSIVKNKLWSEGMKESKALAMASKLVHEAKIKEFDPLAMLKAGPKLNVKDQAVHDLRGKIKEVQQLKDDIQNAYLSGGVVNEGKIEGLIDTLKGESMWLKNKLVDKLFSSGMPLAEATGEAKKVLDSIMPTPPKIADVFAKGKVEAAAKRLPTLKSEDFTKYADKKGSNTGGFYAGNADPGEKYYFKLPDSAAHVDNEILASKLYQAAGVDGLPELTDVRMGGKRGIASKIVDGVEKDRAAITEMGSSLNDSIKENMAVDAWLANWDTVGAGYDNLMVKGGKAHRIDVGGSLLFRAQGTVKGSAFGNEVGELKTFLDKNLNPQSESVFRGVTREQLIVGVKKVASISDDQIRAMVVEFGPKGSIADGLADTLIARKAWLIKEFPEALDGGATTKGIDGVIKPKRKTKAAKAQVAPTEITKEFTDEVETLGFQGKSIPFDKDSIEDQNALVFSEMHEGKVRTVVRLKTRPSADADVVNAISKYGVEAAVPVKKVPTGPAPTHMALKEDVYYEKLKIAHGNIDFHSKDGGKYNMPKVQEALDLKPSLELLAGSTKDDDVFKMAKHYLNWIHEMENAIITKGEITGGFTKLGGSEFKILIPVKPVTVIPAAVKVAKPTGNPFVAKSNEIETSRRHTVNGKMEVIDDNAATKDFFPNSGHKQEIEGKPGFQYTVEFDGDIRVRYNPWVDESWYAQRGDLEIVLPGNATPKLIQEAFDKLQQLGIDSTLATAANAEKMYLEKIAYIRMVDKTNDYVSMMENLRKTGATTEDYVSALRVFMSKELKTADITKIKGYNPMGKYQYGFLDNTVGAGNRLQYRPDLSQADLDKKMENYYLYHNVTNASNMADLMELVMANNGAMLSTTEKIRLGVPAGGMSPSSDMRTGGANYFFTRLLNMKAEPGSNSYRINENTVVFKKDMIRRMDTISYDRDQFGRTTDDFVRENRSTTIADWKKISRKHNNETIFKSTVTLLDNVEYIITGGFQDTFNTLAVFEKYGIEFLPDGRKITDVVITMEQWTAIRETIL